jgi:hypothetical protein
MRTIVAALVLSAMASFARAETPKSELAPADVTKLLAFFDRLVDAVVANKADCAKMAKAVDAVVESSKEVRAMAEKARKENKKLPAAAQQHMLDGAKQMVPAMQQCGGDAAVVAAFKKLDAK